MPAGRARSDGEHPERIRSRRDGDTLTAMTAAPRNATPIAKAVWRMGTIHSAQSDEGSRSTNATATSAAPPGRHHEEDHETNGRVRRNGEDPAHTGNFGSAPSDPYGCSSGTAHRDRKGSSAAFVLSRLGGAEGRN